MVIYAVVVRERGREDRPIYETNQMDLAIRRATDFDGNVASVPENVVVVNRETGDVIWPTGDGIVMLNDASEFTFLTGDVNWEQYGGKWVSKKLNNGEFNYWLVVSFMNWVDATGDTRVDDCEFNAQVEAYSPEWASEEAMKSALSACGLDSPNGLTELALLVVLATTGTGPTLYSINGNDADELLQQAKREAVTISSLIGLYLDSQQNALGATGWDILAGNPLAGLHRHMEVHDDI